MTLLDNEEVDEFYAWAISLYPILFNPDSNPDPDEEIEVPDLCPIEDIY